MGKSKRILAAFLAAAMMVSLVACGEETEERSDSSTSPNDSSSGQNVIDGNILDSKYSDDWIIDKSKYEGKTLTVWAWWDVSEADRERTIGIFEERTGAKVDWQVLSWADYPTQLVTAVSGGSGPDICYVGLEHMPAYAIKNIMLPVSDYLDYDTAPITISPGGRDAYTYKGKVYGLTSIPDSHKLFYRKSAFQNLGIEDPRDIFERGEWTWDKFLEVGRELTYDSDGDGATDKYAYWSWNTFQWFTSNSASFISYDETGTPYFSMGEPNALEALQMIRDMDSANGVYKITAPWMVDHAPDTDLISGRIAMNYTNDSYIGDMNNEGFRSQMGDDLGFVPCPLGPSYTGSNRTADQGGTLGECIGAGSDNPELAVLFMLLKTAPRNAEDEKELAEKAAELQLYKYEDQAGIDLANEMAMNSVFNLAGGYNKLQTIVDNIINDSSATPAQAVEANRAAAENQIAKVLSDSE